MSKELPYFKFFTGEWLNGDIVLEDYELQGLFVNVCAYYWHRNCEVNYHQLAKKFKTNLLSDLVPEFMECDEENDHSIKIEFLNEQFSEFKTRKKQLSDAGKKGAKAKKEKAKFTPPISHPISHPLTTKEDKIKEDKENIKKKTIQERRKDFSLNLLDYIPKFGGKMVNEFFLYWSEHGENDKKMRYEKQVSFSIERRLGTWKIKSKNFKNGSQNNTKDNRATTTKAERQEFD